VSRYRGATVIPREGRMRRGHTAETRSSQSSVYFFLAARAPFILHTKDLAPQIRNRDENQQLYVSVSNLFLSASSAARR
jgi:hypothetical protein